MVPYKGGGKLAKKKKSKSPWFDPNQLAYELGLGAVEGMGKLAKQAFNGVVSAFQTRGMAKQEIKSLVAPLARQLSYTSRRPTFTKAEGGVMIEHIEQINLVASGHTNFLVSSQTFQWLRGIANQFEEYQIKSWYAWNPICPATTTGQVLMAFDYDPNDNVFGQYETSADYFNTADHCISAIWAPAAISPQKSGWLKTGSEGDVRLYSPGRLHVNVTSASQGFFTVRYQVSLRKPQPDPQNNSVQFAGVVSTTTDVFAGAVSTEGDQSLVTSLTPTLLTMAPTPGYKIVVWSIDGNVANLTYTTGSGGRTLGTRVGQGLTYASVFQPNSNGTVSLTLSAAPSPAANWRLSIIQVTSNPLAFTW